MNQEQLLHDAEVWVRAELAGDGSGHDWWHIARVRTLARTIAEYEGADSFICELAALLHDLADAKIAGDEETGKARVREWLVAQGADGSTIEQVMEIIATMSFAGGAKPAMRTLEGRIVQDADRLDAIGAIGIARAFAFGGSRGRLLYDPDVPPQRYSDATAYHASAAPTINHFYEKLLLLKDRMNTPYAQELAKARHRYMETFLSEFFAEWDGER